jgi:AcrR family transcriptional regulator
MVEILMTNSSRRQDLIDTAIDLFNERGFHGVGIEAVIDKAKMSKKTLYTYFRSKEELILASLRHYDGVFRNDFMARVEKASPTPEGRLLAVFDVAEAWFSQNNFFGCLFISAASEYPDLDSPIRQASYEFKKLMRLYMLSLCDQLDVISPQSLASELSLLFEGATVTAQISGEPQAAQVAKKAAKTLIDHALKHKARECHGSEKTEVA